MASENTNTNAGNNEETETTEQDCLDSNSTFSGRVAVNGGVAPKECFTTQTEQKQSTAQGSSAASLTAEIPEPAVGAEVDCPGGNYVEASTLRPQTEEDTGKTAANQPVTIAPPSGGGGRRRQHRPEDRSCCCCSVKFERQGRSFNRRAVFTFTTVATVQWVFPDSVVHNKSFLCENCAQAIRSNCKRKQNGRRSLWLQPPPPKKSDSVKKKKKDRRMGKKSKAAQLVSKSCYRAALKTLWSAKGARKSMMDFWSRQLKEEMKMLSRQRGSPFHQKVLNIKALSSFPWRRCLNWAQDKAPLVTTCLQSLFPDITNLTKIGHPLSEEQAQTVLERRVVVALSIPLFTRNIWKNSFLQAALGADLRLQGCSGAAIDTLNTMGLCQNKDTVRLLLQRLRFGRRPNGRQMIKIKDEEMPDVEEEDIEEVEELELEIEDDDDDEEEEEEEEDEEEEEEEEADIELAVEEEVVEEDGQVGVQEEEEEGQAAKDKEETKRRKKAKKQRKERGKREAEGREEDDDDEGSEQKKRRVVVVRLDGDTQTLDDLTFQIPKTF
ncbi:uncharacterized protein LOC131461521 [Solea solea]|uniref:uncharacterized protein LOC131461521 n=1 Tax=Solea solea TaxID=90069 RepID=UPI00272A1A33|nr:uncharacterized protein LOC131461521 [Solea solea]